MNRINLNSSLSGRGTNFSHPRFTATRVAQPTTIAQPSPVVTETDASNEPLGSQPIRQPASSTQPMTQTGPLTVDLGMLLREKESENRPLLPSLSLSELQATVFGSASSSKMLPRLLDVLGEKAAIYRPSVPRKPDSKADSTKLPI